ncbi:MAG: sigma-70 family RNA polymerase sigma factor [Cyclobacteriaceae bacterium]
MKKEPQYRTFKPASERKLSQYESKKDIELWDDFRNGDDGAFVFIYKDYIQRLYNIGRQVTNSEELVKDCLHDFFLELRSRRETLGSTDNIKLYLFKSFRRKIIKYLEKEIRFTSSDFNEYAIEFSIETKIINAQISKEQLQNLQLAISQLSKKEREIVFYFFYENMSYQEIAELLDYNHVSSARRFIYNLIKKLREHMPIVILILLQDISSMQLHH